MAKESNSSKKATKNVGGAPIQYTGKVLAEISEKMDKYTEETELPIVAEFAYLNKMRRQTLYDHAGLADSLRRMIDKKEFTLERKGLEGDYNSNIVKYSLSQMGWSEKNETKHTGTVTHDYSKMSDEELQAILENEE